MSCPRCGQASKNPSNKQGRCAKHLKELARNRQNPSRYEHLHRLADSALRRQDGKNGTAHKKTKGRGTRQGIIAKMRAGYAKYGKGRLLSPDRKNLKEGYSSTNTRPIPRELNRGRHDADTKKIARWRESVRKSELTEQEIITMATARAMELGKPVLELIDEDPASFLALTGSRAALAHIIAVEEPEDMEELLDFADTASPAELEEALEGE